MVPAVPVQHTCDNAVLQYNAQVEFGVQQRHHCAEVGRDVLDDADNALVGKHAKSLPDAVLIAFVQNKVVVRQ